MKKLFTTFITLHLLISSTAQSLEMKSPDGRELLLGQWDVQRLQRQPYAAWFGENYAAYHLDKAMFNAFRNVQNSFDSVTLFMGTWCGDSRREVPRFIKILDTLDFDRDKLALICVDNELQNYKQSPGREEAGQNIHRVPVFIFHREGQEIGRIVETPRESLEKDIFKIITGQPYVPHYQAVSEINRLFEEHGLGYVQARKAEIAEKLKDEVNDSYELNTYGLVLFSSFQLGRARAVYELNKLLFPDEYLPYYSLGKFEAISGNREAATVDLEKALDLAPENDNIKTYLESVREL